MNDVYTSVFELIDMRSFSNLWYWIALAVMWSTASHWVLGVPFDMVSRARKYGGQTMIDLEDLTRINVNRLLFIGRMAGIWLVAVFCFILSGLFTAGFVLANEFAQATFLLVFPLSIIWLLSVNTAKLIEMQELHGEALCRRITRHRFHIQVLGILFIFVTAMWGMYQNFSMGVLGR
ncbi:component of SufBCD complex [Primorskyibacter sp. S187A]|uniref:component of SufBCD complex n=1 Tax=Primorskyibacter sp. S187A TaxID=3415130 RepID=UPI003C7B8E6D